MTAIGYTRCSTVEQADSGLGIDAQTERIQAYADMRGLALVEIVSDPGISGGKPLASREGGQKLLRLIGRRRASVVIALKLDRLFRNAANCLTTVEGWDKLGVALHVVDLGGNAIDTTSAAGRFMLTVLAATAEMERNLTRERTKAALSVKRSRGERIGAIPYGYDLTDGGMLIPNEAEQGVIRRIQKLRSSDLTLKQIAETLTQEQIPTKTGRSITWRHQSVASILKRAATASEIQTTRSVS